jgi:hypothetical protein
MDHRFGAARVGPAGAHRRVCKASWNEVTRVSWAKTVETRRMDKNG